MCETSTLFFLSFVTLAPGPHTKKLATPLMSPDRKKKIVSSLRSLPPPPPQSKTASGAPDRISPCVMGR